MKERGRLACFKPVFLAAGLALALAVAAPRAGAQEALAAPLDLSLYREEAIRRVESRHGDWFVRCQEIIPLRRRFCNIAAPLRDGGGRSRGVFLVTTDHAGKPGILLKIESPLVVSQPLAISARFEAVARKRKASVRYERKLSPVICGRTCDFVMPLESELAFALNSGVEIEFAVATIASGDWKTGFFVRGETLRVSGAGFDGALKATASAPSR